MRKIVIIGDSGHAKVVEDVLHSSSVGAVFAKLDDKYSEVFIEHGIIKGPIAHIHSLIERDTKLGILFGIGSNEVRKKLVSLLSLPTDVYITAIHQSAVISPSATIGVGTVIMPGVIVNANAQVGDHVILNSGCVIEHDNSIADYVHVSPKAVLTGGVIVGEGSHIGAGASIIPGHKIGEWAVVGAGAVVVSNVDDGTTVVGVPAKVVKREGM